jgi:hypothetical protein
MDKTDRNTIRAIQADIESLRGVGDDYLIVSVGVRGPNIEMPGGNAIATVRMGHEEASAEAKYLDDAIALARAAIVRAREAKAKKRAKKDLDDDR